MADFEDFLSGVSREGTVDSTGEFTIALEKARQKLQQYQLADPAFYVLKVFQAAVRAGTDTIKLRLGRRTLDLWFEVPNQVYPLEATVKSMDGLLDQADSGKRHLVLGLNASLVLDPEQVRWSEWTSDGGRSLVIEHKQLRTEETAKRPQRGFPKPDHFGYHFSLSKEMRSLFGPSQTAQEHAALSQRCGFAPIQVVLDGRQLSGGWKSKASPPWLEELSEPFYLAERIVSDPDGALAAPPLSSFGYKRVEGVSLRKNRSQKTYCYQCLDTLGSPVEPNTRSHYRCRGAYALPLALTGSNSVTVIKDGVLLESVKVTGVSSMGAMAIVDGNHLRVDMSEFKLIRDEAFQELLRETNCQWESLADLCRTHLPGLKRVYTRAEKSKQGEKQRQSFTCGGLSCCLAPLLLIGVAPGLGEPWFQLFVGASFLGGLASPYVVSKEPDLDQKLREGVRARLHRVGVR